MSHTAVFALACLSFGCASTAQDASSPSESASMSMGPQFYEVRGNGASGYLFGTVHLHDERTQNLPTAVEAAFLSSDALYVEMKPDLAGAMKMLSLTLLPKGSALDAVVGEETWKRIGDRFEKVGRPRKAATQFNRNAPWVPLTQVAFLDNYESDDPVLDLDFSLRAKEDGMSIHGLETVEQQLSLFTDLTLEEQTLWLENLLDRLERYDEEGRSMTEDTLEAWHSGDPAKLYGLREQVFDISPRERADVERDFLWKRNERFAEGIDRALRESPEEVVFVAIGAMHLPNAPEVNVASERERQAPRRLGVAELLRLRGYTVTRLRAGTDQSPSAASTNVLQAPN